MEYIVVDEEKASKLIDECKLEFGPIETAHPGVIETHYPKTPKPRVNVIIKKWIKLNWVVCVLVIWGTTNLFSMIINA